MIVVHRVFRRESDLMPTLIQAVPNGDTARAGVLAQAFSDYQLGLHLHHTGEDELVWPLLLARVDLEADMVLRMETQHEVVAGALAEASRRMPDWRSAPSAATAPPLVSALTEHRAALLEHLHDEEEYILPLIEEHLTVAEWARLGQRFAEEVPKDKMLLFLGMILEDGLIKLQIADLQTFPGHREWVRSRPDLRPIGGFSMLIRAGAVKGFFPLSALNRTPDARLPESWIAQILIEFPEDADQVIYD